MAENAGVVIVTGDGGFIGRAIVERLSGRYRVVVLNQQEATGLPSSANFAPMDLASDAAVHEAACAGAAAAWGADRLGDPLGRLVRPDRCVEPQK